MLTYKDKRLTAVAKSKPGQSVKGLQPGEVTRIRVRFQVLQEAQTLSEVSDAHPEWRVHEWEGHKGYFSIDVLGNTRLLFDYDKKAHQCLRMVYDDPH